MFKILSHSFYTNRSPYYDKFYCNVSRAIDKKYSLSDTHKMIGTVLETYFKSLKDDISKYSFLTHVMDNLLNFSIPDEILFSLFPSSNLSGSFLNSILFTSELHDKSFVCTNTILGKGVYATVYEGQYVVSNKGDQSDKQQRFAVKITSFDRSYPWEILNTFKEISILNTVSSHDNFCDFYQSSTFDNLEKNIVLIMEKGHACTLDFCSRFRNSIMQELKEALSFLHRHGVCHNDLKIENLILGEDNRIKIVDFGLSIFFDTQSNSTLLKTSNLKELHLGGTYPPPEKMLETSAGQLYVTQVNKIDSWHYGLLCLSFFVSKHDMNINRFQNVGRRKSDLVKYKDLQSLHNLIDNYMRVPYKSIIERCLEGDPPKRASICDLPMFFK